VVELAGPRVRLRQPTFADLEALVALHEDDSGTMTRESGDAAREKLRKRIERSPTLEDGGFLSLVVEVDGEPIGDVQARAPQNGFPPGVCEIGISLASTLRGKGYGREAVELFTAHLLENGWPRVQASTALDNVAMRRVLERAGYVYEGVLHSFAPGDAGAREDYVLYSRFRSGGDGDPA
jgi:RimJ/RimL family protein N-acetyltransferase